MHDQQVLNRPCIKIETIGKVELVVHLAQDICFCSKRKRKQKITAEHRQRSLCKQTTEEERDENRRHNQNDGPLVLDLIAEEIKASSATEDRKKLHHRKAGGDDAGARQTDAVLDNNKLENNNCREDQSGHGKVNHPVFHHAKNSECHNQQVADKFARNGPHRAV